VVGRGDDPVDELMETSMAVAAVGSDG
jgi:hypothetical protein